MTDPLAVLRDEFELADDSFLLRLRGDLIWDRAAFTRLEQAMRATCERREKQGEDIPSWLAEGFYRVSHYVPEWTGHPSFPRPEPIQYYLDCLDRLRDLTDWFFTGSHGYQEPHVWPDL